MRKVGVLLRTAAAASLVASPVRSQQPDTLVVTLHEALEIARRSNPEYLRAADQLRLNGPETRAAWASGILPSLSLNLLSTGYGGNLQKRAFDDFGNPVANPDAEYVYFSNTEQGLALNWTVRGPSLWYRLEQIRLANEARTLGGTTAGEALRLDVTRAFYETLEQEELLAAERGLAAAGRTDLEATERLFELALRNRIEVLNAELRIEQQELAVRRQQRARDQARLALRALLGQTDLPLVRPVSTPVALLDPYHLDEGQLTRRAVAGSAAVRQADVTLRSAEVSVRESRASYWPTLTANFRIGRFAQAQRAGSLFALGGFGDELYSGFSLGLSLPFFNNAFGNRAAMARAEVARDGQEDALHQARLGAEQDASSALLALRNRWDELRICERSLAIATEVLELAREEYRLGTRTFERLQESVRSEADARRQLIQARYGFVDARLDLEAAVGAPVR